MSSGPPCQAAWKASAVFLGTVAEVTRESRQPESRGSVQVNGFLGTYAVFEIAEGFLGMDGRSERVEIRTGMGGGDCGYAFQLGQSYVVYAYQNKDRVLVASICSRTAPAHSAQEDLRYLRSLKNGLSMANYQFCLSARVFDLLIPSPECAISLFYSFI
jgi:hypothetical protein